MRTRAETRLVLLVIVVSLGLTALTVWAFYRQGAALRDRQWADLVSSATTAAAERSTTLLGDVQRAADLAGEVWQRGGLDELDVWAANQPNWLLAFVHAGGSSWQVLPLTPLEQPLPDLRDDTDANVPAAERDLRSTLDYFRRLASSPDPLTRAAALVATATYEQQLGHPLAAARILAEAAELLRSTPGLARHAFRAELARIDSLLAAPDRPRARETLGAFLNRLLADHPGRLGPREINRLRQQAGALTLADDDPQVQALSKLEGRAIRRQRVADAVLARLAGVDAATRPTDSAARFQVATTAAGEPVVVAVRRIGEQETLALAGMADDLVNRYWPAEKSGAGWRVVPPAERGDAPALVELGPAFAGAVAVPTADSQTRLQAADVRRLAVVAAAAAGSVGAWALVIWMMLRVMARQRELSHLQSRFVADVSHELKTPLALIRLLAETLAEGRVADPQRARSYHETITRESERLSSLLDNILDLGRIESGRKRYEFGACNLAAVARQAWSLFEPQFAAEGFESRLELAADLPEIQADSQAVQQVLVNLLQNAYRYAGSGKYVRLSAVREGHLVVVAVEDHGIGMSRTQLTRLGESFFRGDDARVRQTRGTGLGLAIVNHIVTAHHGKMEVHSQPGRGSRFTVWIPIDGAADSAT